VRILVDTGATESCISEQFVKSTKAKVRSKPEELHMANGSIAVSQGTVVLPVSMQTYQEEVVAKVFPMHDKFDMILGSDWCRAVQCNILFSTNMLSIQSDLNGYSHMIAIQPVQFGSLCPIISAVDFPNHIAEDDVTFMCTVTSADESCTTDNGQDKVQDLLSRYSDVFPADLPAELPPERNVFHTIPLADDKATPPS